MEIEEIENSLNVKWFVWERHWRCCDLSVESCLVLFSAACQSSSLLALWLPYNTPASHNLDQQINTTGGAHFRAKWWRAFEHLESLWTAGAIQTRNEYRKALGKWRQYYLSSWQGCCVGGSCADTSQSLWFQSALGICESTTEPIFPAAFKHAKAWNVDK